MEKEKKEKKSITRLFALNVNAKSSHRNIQYSPYCISKCLKSLFHGLYTIFFLVPAIAEAAMEALPWGLDLLLKMSRI